jgi:hypothetical protein
LALLILLLSLAGCAPAPSTTADPVSPEQLKVGIRLNEQARMKVVDIRAGDESVKSLFQDMEYTELAGLKYFYAKHEIPLSLRSPESLKVLLKTLNEQDTDRLAVFLRDDQDGHWRRKPGLGSEDRYTKTVYIPVLMSTCDEVTRLIYKELNLIIQRQSESQGTTEKRISLDEVFDLLMRERIEPYIKGLDQTKKSDPCFETFELYKWLKREKAAGFESGEYSINEGLQGLLGEIADALLDQRRGKERFDLRVEILGRTDGVPVAGIALQADKTGIKEWDALGASLEQIHYGGCSGDYLSGTRPVYVDFASGAGIKVWPRVNNNCELGAVRAYVAAVYLMKRLGHDHVSYSYATGGVYPDKSESDDKRKRMVEIDLTVRAVNAGE